MILALMKQIPNKIQKIKFILIDHSLEGEGGHHFDYCLRVLRTAKDFGCKTILLANHKFVHKSLPGVDVLVRKFHKNYWHYKNSSKLKIPINFPTCSREIIYSNNDITYFAQELQSSLEEIDSDENDLIFLPMLGATELLGVTLFSRLNPAYRPHWNFVFRRSFALGFDIRSMIEKKIISSALNEFSDRINDASVNFYADTEKLCGEYTRLGIYKFMTLPVPVFEESKLKKKWDGVRPLRVVYLGDARDEKGFQNLPGLIKGIRSAGWGAESIHFIFQSNLSSGGHSKSLKAKNKLKLSQDMGLTLVEGPLDSDQYSHLLVGSDIVLLPYSSREYSSRSSGIFAEAAAAGIPTIFPKGSWMAQEAMGACGIGFDSSKLLLDATLIMLNDYTKYESQSMGLSDRYRNKYSSRKLVDTLLSNSLRGTEIK